MKDFIGYLIGAPDPLETIIYDCDPLVIANVDDEILFAGRVDVEFTPSAPKAVSGVAVIVDGKPGGPRKLHVRDQINVRVNPDVDVRTRGGLTWFGEDDKGVSYSWYVGKAADTYLLNRGSADA